jgi:AcrR family transcriptional regulator
MAYDEAVTPATGQPKRRLRRGDWIEAALEAIERGGRAAVRVEALATRLGVTKGSFYSHFHSRDELIEAALESWERGRGDTIERFAEIEDPGQRLRQMLLEAVTFTQSGRVSAHMILLGELGDQRVRSAVARVTESRLELLTRSYRELGFSAQRATHRARLAYAIYRGLLQMAREAPEQRLGERELGRFLDEVNSVLVGPGDPGRLKREIPAHDQDGRARSRHPQPRPSGR